MNKFTTLTGVAAPLAAGAAEVALYRLERLRLGSGTPFAVQTTYLSVEQFGPDLLSTAKLTESVFDLYASMQRWPMRSDETIRARFPTRAEHTTLAMDELPPEQQLVYLRDRMTYDQLGMILEVTQTIERSDLFVSYRYVINAS